MVGKVVFSNFWFWFVFVVFGWSIIIFTLHQIKSEFMEERFIEVGTSLEMEKQLQYSISGLSTGCDVIPLCRSPSPSFLSYLVLQLSIMNNETNWIALLSSLFPDHICDLSLYFSLLEVRTQLYSHISSGFSSKVVVFPVRFILQKEIVRMEREETHTSLRYGRPPWIFKGSAVYQLHLVKAETARAFIPKEFQLVEAFGYTLGGFFLASYDDSPTGTFDELVVIAGIVWNPPTSCAWAASVLVNSCEACAHGRKDVGLPSQVARFSKTITAIPKSSKDKRNGFLDMVGAFASQSPKSCMDVQVSEFKGQTSMNICNINFELDSSKWMGPSIKMSLPSFSGRTKYNPHLLKYSCQIECRVRAVSPAMVSGPHAVDSVEDNHSEHESSICNFDNGENMQNKRNLCLSVMLSKPILALQFNSLKMKVEAPTVVTRSLRQ